MLVAPATLAHKRTEGPTSSSAAIRSRSTSRPCTHVPSSNPSSNIAPPRAGSKRALKPSSTPARSSTENHRSEALLRNVEQRPDPSFHPNRVSTSDPRTEAALLPLEDIHEQDPNKLLQLLASLLQHIASANDQIRPSPSTSPASISACRPDSEAPPSSLDHCTPIWSTLTSASRQAYTTQTSCLTFHARNIPTITLEAYLLRILKYCPTTNEVFLSLLVYFDRMSKLAFDVTGKGFAIDSFNVHRLVIAGVTVASKFFSDVFYTNSRYAKVGGLPQSELNQLELQFLLLNDFRLSIAAEEMQRYAEQLQVYSQNADSGMQSLPSVSDRPQLPPQFHTNPRDLIAMSMRRMGAADAYGGRLPGEPMTEAETVQETYGGVVGYDKAIQLECKADKNLLQHGKTEPHPCESGMETGVEAEEEGVETDDEPTIRAHSSAGSETQSLCTVDSEDAFSEREPEDERSESRVLEHGAITMGP